MNISPLRKMSQLPSMEISNLIKYSVHNFIWEANNLFESRVKRKTYFINLELTNHCMSFQSMRFLMKINVNL